MKNRIELLIDWETAVEEMQAQADSLIESLRTAYDPECNENDSARKTELEDIASAVSELAKLVSRAKRISAKLDKTQD